MGGYRVCVSGWIQGVCEWVDTGGAWMGGYRGCMNGWIQLYVQVAGARCKCTHTRR